MTIRKQLARMTRRVRTATPDRPRALSDADLRAIAGAANRYFYLGAELALVRLNSGLLLYVDPLDEHVSANIIAHGDWEIWVRDVVLSLLKPGARVVEVGANVGYYTTTMAHAVGPAGHVTALEANPRMAALVQRSITLNGFASRTRVIPKAALDQPGAIDFVVSRRNSGGGYVSLWEDQPYEDGEKLRVEAVRLDDQNLGSVDMIRIDAEGSEPFILRGAEAILRANPDIVICMEWSVVQMSSRTSVADFVAWMGELGFGFWRIGYDAGLTPVPLDRLASLDACDLVAARRLPQRP